MFVLVFVCRRLGNLLPVSLRATRAARAKLSLATRRVVLRICPLWPLIRW